MKNFGRQRQLRVCATTCVGSLRSKPVAQWLAHGGAPAVCGPGAAFGSFRPGKVITERSPRTELYNEKRTMQSHGEVGVRGSAENTFSPGMQVVVQRPQKRHATFVTGTCFGVPFY